MSLLAALSWKLRVHRIGWHGFLRAAAREALRGWYPSSIMKNAMDTVREAAVLDALRSIVDPDLHRDIVSLGFVKNLKIDSGKVTLDIELTTPACPVKETMREEAVTAVRAVPGVTAVEVNMTAQVRRAAVSPSEGGMRRVRNVVAIASGKGG